MSKRKVVVTGIGIISPLGLNTTDTWSAVCDGKSGVSEISHFDTEGYTCRIAAEIRNFDPETIVEKKNVRRYDRYSLFALQAAKEAWADSNLEGHAYQQGRMGCILGVGIGGLQTLEDNHELIIKGGPRKVSPFLIPALISNLGPGHIAIEHGLKGVNYTVTSACTSGTHAVGEAYRMISDGLQDVVLAGGAEAAITRMAVAGFARMKALSTRNDEPQKASRPFDKGRDGFVMGEGAAILVLEAEESAKKRGAKIYAEVGGYGFSCDASHMTAPSATGEGAIACMQGALNDGKLDPTAIQYINAHGTSTPINDPAETAAIKHVFGKHAKSGLLVSSTKSMTGHLLGAAGGIEAAFCALALRDSIVPPTINLDDPEEGCDLDYVPHTAREVSVEAVMSNSFGFGGTNASIILKRAS